jgi:hypothetical protein
MDGVLLFLSELPELPELPELGPPTEPRAPDEGDEDDEDDKLSINEPIEPEGIENLTSERTGIKIIPLFESAITFIKGSSEDNEDAAPAAAPRTAPSPARTPSPCPRLSAARIFSGILIFLILMEGFLGFASLFGFESI